jgi:hypothetical protein
MNRTKLAVTLLTVMIGAGACLAQTEAPKQSEATKAYQLDFVLKELEDGKVVNSRNYSLMITAVGGGGSIRSGDRVSVLMKGGGATQPEYSYLDVGVNIDCAGVLETQGKLTLNVKADISTAQPETSRPLIRTTRWSSNVIVPLRKATVLFTSDDTSSKRRMQLELTAAPVN